MIKAALIGFGAVARHGHLPWYLEHESVQLAGVVEPTLSGRATAQSLLPHVPVFSCLHDLLNSSSLSFVDITAHPAVHCELILNALEAGVNVICEKPVVTDLEALHSVEKMRGLCGAIIAGCHNWYFAPAISRALELIAADEIGEPKTVSFTAHRPQSANGADHWKPAWRRYTSEGGGIVSDLGYHGFYISSRIFQSAPVMVRTARIDDGNEDGGAECAAQVELEFPAGKHAELRLSWVSKMRETSLHVCGSRGTLSIENDMLSLRNNGKRSEPEQFGLLTADSWHPSWIARTLDTFLDAVEKGDDVSLWRDIQWSVAALDAAQRSMKSGKAVLTGLNNTGVALSACEASFQSDGS